MFKHSIYSFIQVNRIFLTDARDDVELVVDLLVHSRGDDTDFGEGVRHRVDPHLCHEQGQQEDLVLCYVVVLQEERGQRERKLKDVVDWSLLRCNVAASDSLSSIQTCDGSNQSRCQINDFSL